MTISVAYNVGTGLVLEVPRLIPGRTKVGKIFSKLVLGLLWEVLQGEFHFSSTSKNKSTDNFLV